MSLMPAQHPLYLTLLSTLDRIDPIQIRHFVAGAAILLPTITYLFRPSPLRNCIALSTFILLHVALHYHPKSTDPDVTVQFYNLVMLTHRTWFDLLLTRPDFPGPLKRYRVVKTGDAVAEEGMGITTERSIWKRLKWGLDYSTNFRGIGWSWHVAGCPPVTPSSPSAASSRIRCILRCLRALFLRYLIMDIITNHWQARQPFWMYKGLKEGYGSSMDGGWLLGWFNGVVSVVGARVMIEMVYIYAAVITVTLGICKPEAWPPLFSPISSIYRLRSFWNKGWHQMLRDQLETPSRFLLPYLPRINASPTARSYFRLFTAFFLSGLFHYRAILEMPWPALPATKNTPGKGWDQHVFFNLQALAILGEDIVIALYTGTQLGPPTPRAAGSAPQPVRETEIWKKVLGWTWLAVWFGFTMRYLSDESVICGLAGTMRLPSLVGWAGGVIGVLGEGGK